MKTLNQYHEEALSWLKIRRMRISDELVGEIVAATLRAEIDFNPELGSKEKYIDFLRYCSAKIYFRRLKNFNKKHILMSDVKMEHDQQAEDVINNLYFDKHDIFSEIFDNNLTNREKIVIYRLYWLKQTMAEIGKVLNITAQTVCNTRRRAIEKLRVLYNG